VTLQPIEMQLLVVVIRDITTLRNATVVVVIRDITTFQKQLLVVVIMDVSSVRNATVSSCYKGRFICLNRDCCFKDVTNDELTTVSSCYNRHYNPSKCNC
jgi:hypothetical protein